VGLDPEDVHQPLDAFAIHFQFDGHFAAAVKRTLQIQLVESAEEPKVLRALRPRLVIPSRARHSQQFALLLNRETRMIGIDPWTLVFSR
jgi:hypothetical protein